MWHLVSRNREAMSCADAAHKRRRLAHRGRDVGIPLCDELKTAAWTVDDGAASIVLLHCRGHQLLDEDKVADLLGSRARRMDAGELEDRLNLGYGLVTPFAGADNEIVRQVFDRTVVEPFFPPYTMMTNLGHREYAVEFDPRDLLGVLPHTLVECIVQDDLAGVPVEHTLGILTGNGPESGRLLWSRIDGCIRSDDRVPFRGDIGLPRVVVESMPEMGLSMELEMRVEAVRPAVLAGVRRLCERGATAVGIACNTTQYFVDEICDVCQQYDAKFVSLVDVTAERLRKEGVQQVAFLGIGAVSDFAEWSDFRRIASEFALERPSDELIERINDLAFLVKQRGVVSETVNPMRDIVRSAAGEDAVVLVALTELSLLVASQRRSQRRFIDTVQILAEAMADIYLQPRIPLEINPEHESTSVDAASRRVSGG